MWHISSSYALDMKERKDIYKKKYNYKAKERGKHILGIQYTVKKVIDFPVPSRDVTNLFLPCTVPIGEIQLPNMER